MTIKRLEEELKNVGTIHNQDQQFEVTMITSQLMLYKRALNKGCLTKATDELVKHHPVAGTLSI